MRIIKDIKNILPLLAVCGLLLAACGGNTDTPDTTLLTDDAAALAFGDPVEDAVEEVLPQA